MRVEYENNKTEIEPKKLKRMLIMIMGVERKNSKTKQMSDSQMVDKIQKIIEEEVECL